MRLQYLGERFDPWAVFAGIADEDVTHRQCPVGLRPLPGRGLVKKPYGLVQGLIGIEGKARTD